MSTDVALRELISRRYDFPPAIADAPRAIGVDDAGMHGVLQTTTRRRYRGSAEPARVGTPLAHPASNEWMRRRSTLALLAVPLLLFALAATADSAYGAHVLPGVRVAGVPVGGLSPDEARSRLIGAAADLGSRRVSVRVGDRVVSRTNAELGIVADVDAAVAAAMSLGRSRSFPARVGDWLDAVTSGADLPLPRRAADGRLDDLLAAIAGEVDRDPLDGAISITAEGVRVVDPAAGARLDLAALRDALLASGDLGDREAIARVAVVEPVIGHEEMRHARAAVAAAHAPLAVEVGDRRVELELARVARLVRVARAPVGGGRETLRAWVDEAALGALVAELADRSDRAPRDAAFRPGGERLEVVPGVDGVAIDRVGLGAALRDALFATGSDRVARVEATGVPPAFTTEAARDAAAKMTLVGSFTTWFPANAARETNIRLAAARFDGMLLRPGESFSFWERIGEVSYRTGFVDAGVIIDGRSDKGLAGGICQVSTTFFNAVARAAYRIDERHPHAYYIERYPLGLDAAVALPGADLRWTNDTGEPVYIRTASTPTSVTFWLYSPPTGRRVTFLAPAERNFTEPAADQAADTAYPVGYVVRGRDVWAIRVVTANGLVVRRDSWYSHYRPVWGGPAAQLIVR